MRRLATALEGRASLIVDANQAWNETTALRCLPVLVGRAGRHERLGDRHVRNVPCLDGRQLRLHVGLADFGSENSVAEVLDELDPPVPPAGTQPPRRPRERLPRPVLEQFERSVRRAIRRLRPRKPR